MPQEIKKSNEVKNKILIIEDDAFLMELVVKILEKAGFSVSGAFDGEEGLKKIEEEKPDLILLDIILPGIDGFEVLKQIKQNPAIAPIPVIFLTNLGQADDIKKGSALGVDDYLIKAHLMPDEIVEKVKKVLSRNSSLA